jgi:hypothetical protein
MVEVCLKFRSLNFEFLAAALAVLVFTVQSQTLPLPQRSASSPTGSEFAARAASLDLGQREQLAYTEIVAGNIPSFLLKLCPVTVTNSNSTATNIATYYVTPDYLAIGSDEDYLLLPLSPNTAQRLADSLGCSLPTRKMVDDIYATAEVKLSPTPIPPSAAMTTVAVFSNHNAIVRAQRREQMANHPLGRLTAGHKKDVVISAKLPEAAGKVTIYGWHKTNGAPIQPLYLGHTSAWVDYSQCIRLVRNELKLNGHDGSIAAVLADPATAPLLSDEGVIHDPWYPTNSTAAPSARPPEQSGGRSTGQSPQAGFSGFRETNGFGERIASFNFAPEIKIEINAPPGFGRSKKVLLIFFALPNGNTTAQTIGKAMQAGDDWHFDIQHIGAQTRFLRNVLPDRSIVVAYLENNLKSWPAWRKKYGDERIPKVIAEVRGIFGTNELEIALTSHSGGGSFIFGYLNDLKEIPNEITRIAFLDGNYAYDSSLGHTEKLAGWLRSGTEHFLTVLAYNDAVALLDGKSFVSAAGGTWGKSHEMQRDLVKMFEFTARTNAGFETYSALSGRLEFILKENPERKIFHTVQVERNGFIHAILCGTTNENRCYEYFGARAYTNWIK